jgi:type VI protein secretion system component VasF
MSYTNNRNIETVCRPVFTCFCNYWQLNEAGHSPTMEKFREEIESALENAKYISESDPTLSREYQRVELPLVFFIDYMVKEGGFPFKNEWRELSRNYNELSGDEKFFNLLSEALENPNDKNTIPVFFTMLRLGFDGVYADDIKSIEKTMRQCIAKMPAKFDIHEDTIVNIDTEKRLALSKNRKRARYSNYLRVTLVASLIFMVLSFIINFFTFLNASSTFRKSLSEAAAAAQMFEIPGGGLKNE